MPAAGEYVDRLQWLKRTPAANPDKFGQPVYTYPSQGFLWCAVDDLIANRETQRESERQVTTATIRVRNYPAVAVADQLVDQAEGITYTLMTVLKGDNEMICEVQYPRVS